MKKPYSIYKGHTSDTLKPSLFLPKVAGEGQ